MENLCGLCVEFGQTGADVVPLLPEVKGDKCTVKCDVPGEVGGCEFQVKSKKKGVPLWLVVLIILAK